MTEEKKKYDPEAFVSYVIRRMNGVDGKNPDTGFAALLRRADNPATEHQSWEHLAKWCNLEKEWERLPFAVVSAALAKAKPKQDGAFGIGKAIARCYEDGNESDAAKAKLRRVLACKTIDEVCEVLRPVVSLISSRGVKLDHARLLSDLLYFGEKVRIRWATDFYGKPKEDEA